MLHASTFGTRAASTDPAPRRGVFMVIVGPSGSGKSTVMEAILAADPATRRSVGMTTRPPRTGEVDGLHYHFRSPEEFAALLAADGLLEHATVFGRSYGVPRAEVEATLAAGTDIVTVVDWQGHRTLCAKLPADVVGVYLKTPTVGDLEGRLQARGDKPEDVARRMADAASELSHEGEFRHVVVNRDLTEAVEAVRGILQAARLAREPQLVLARH